MSATWGNVHKESEKVLGALQMEDGKGKLAATTTATTGEPPGGSDPGGSDGAPCLGKNCHGCVKSVELGFGVDLDSPT
jgi:hypothetical protein